MDKYEKKLHNSIVFLIGFLSTIMFSEQVPVFYRVMALCFLGFYGCVLYKINNNADNANEVHKRDSLVIVRKVAMGTVGGFLLNCVYKNCIQGVF